MEEDRTTPSESGESEVGLRRVKKPNFWIAMGAYVALAALAGLTLNGPSVFEARLRALVWLLLAALAVRTWIHRIRARH
jgi:hypothetical protein